MVSAYCEEPVAYCLVADLVSAERRGCRRACIVAMKLSRRQSYVYGRISRIGEVGELVLSELRHTSRDFFGCSLAQSQNSTLWVRPRPKSPRKYLVLYFTLLAVLCHARR
jgi:hypothetical protein